MELVITFGFMTDGFLTKPMTARKNFVLTPPLVANSPLATGGEQLGFTANSVIVQNPTASYWFLPDVGVFIQPGQTNVVVSLPGTQVARIQNIPPDGLTNPTIAQTLSAQFTFVEDAIPPNPGSNIAGSNVGRGVLWSAYDAIAGFTYLAPSRQACPDGLTFVPRYTGVSPVFLTNLLIGVTMPDVAAGGIITLNSFGASSINWIGTSGVGIRTPPIKLAGFFPAGCTIQITCTNAHSGYLVA